MTTVPAATRPPSLRHASLASVLDSFWDADVLTVTELMAATGLARVTVHAVCNELVGSGWVRELDAAGAEQRVGRPARRFTLDERAGYVLGVDVGEFNVNVAVADLRGVTVAKLRSSNPRRPTSPAGRVREVTRTVDAALLEAGATLDDVLAAGVGLAAPVSSDGRVALGRMRGNRYWDGFRIADRLRGALGNVPTLVANDANLAALGERWRGAAQGVDTFITLLAGNRLGAGIIDSGRLLQGSAGGAGEMAFLEELFAGSGADGVAALARQWATEAIATGRPTALAAMSGDRAGAVTPELVFAAAAGGDAVAAAVLERLADRLATVIAMLSTLLNPELVVLGGAVARSLEVLLAPIAERLATRTFTPPRLACSTFGDAIVTVGAVRLALDHVRERALDRWLPVGAAASPSR